MLQKYLNKLFLKAMDALSAKKVVLANKTAIDKMHEINDSLTQKKIKDLEAKITQFSKELKDLIELSKSNQEFLLYLCTTNEELLNLISEGDRAFSEEEAELLEGKIAGSQTKKGNVLN